MFRISNLAENISLEVNGNFKLKKIKFFTSKEKQHRFENKGVCGIIINCSSPSPATRSVSSYNANKKAKISYQPSKTYHRWFLCADAMNPPHTFAIVTHTHQQTCDLLQHVRETSFMGMPFYLVEPDLSTSRVGEYLHILENKGEKLYPLRTNARVLKKPAPVELPSGTDQTYYFVLEGERIMLTRMKFSTSTCTGYQCDRHWGKDGCVCAYGSMGNSLVYEFDFEIPVDKKDFNSDTHVTSISSFRTMSVFFNDLIEYTHATTGPKEEKVIYRRRSQVRRMIRYINANGGWKIIGWCRRGLLSIDGEAEKVENRDINLRLSYVYPQNQKIFDDPYFKSLRIKEDFDVVDNMLSNMDLVAEDSSDSDDSEDSEAEKKEDSNEPANSDASYQPEPNTQQSVSSRSSTEATTPTHSLKSTKSVASETEHESNVALSGFPESVNIL